MSRPSLRAAINAMCKGCLYDPGNGNGAWREQVQRCSSSSCALHPVRPMPVKVRKSDEDACTVSLPPATAKKDAQALSTEKVGRNDVMPDVGRAA